jgi:rRNA maturation endonuclease Nob1
MEHRTVISATLWLLAALAVTAVMVLLAVRFREWLMRPIIEDERRRNAVCPNCGVPVGSVEGICPECGWKVPDSEIEN